MSESGRRLYELLPEVYRSRDNAVRDADGNIVVQGDQAKYLDACGQLLDLIKTTLDQRLKDSHPDTCQEWLLPYFADLLDVRLVSPDADGQREEIAHAVSWRKGKGTLPVADAIADAVGQFEAELQEGWKRVALTPRIGMPLSPATALGESEEIDTDNASPSRIAQHPGLLAATVDVRQASQAIFLQGNANAAAKEVDDRGVRYWWYQANMHGNPCSPGSFD
ncbi:MAG: phage tail protein, partial [Mariprofundaceae bacterium]|nr:phage tail protein [Mariprofundaceae bacterium]